MTNYIIGIVAFISIIALGKQGINSENINQTSDNEHVQVTASNINQSNIKTKKWLLIK
jgi:hypothetical protein